MFVSGCGWDGRLGRTLAHGNEKKATCVEFEPSEHGRPGRTPSTWQQRSRDASKDMAITANRGKRGHVARVHPRRPRSDLDPPQKK